MLLSHVDWLPHRSGAYNSHNFDGMQCQLKGNADACRYTSAEKTRLKIILKLERGLEVIALRSALSLSTIPKSKDS